MCIIPDGKPVFHPAFSRRTLYAGSNLALLQFLQSTLEDCAVVRCPDGSQARLFIEHIQYSLLLFDEELPDTTGQELADFARQFSHKQHTPVLIIKKSDSFELLASTITRLLISPQ